MTHPRIRFLEALEIFLAQILPPLLCFSDGLVWSNDPGSYAGGSVATSRVSYAEQVKDDDPHQKECPPLKKKVFEKPNDGSRLIILEWASVIKETKALRGPYSKGVSILSKQVSE
jgi:hypothetical protein